MTFAIGGPLGQGVLVPCKRNPADVAALLAEAMELWRAEKPDAEPGSIGASWGCVGVLFRDQPASGDWLREWADHFSRNPSPVSAVGSDGSLRIRWPAIAVDGSDADVDVLLAIATKPDSTRPLADDVADAWINQDQGHERYFFENVRHGIRTPEDGLIWRRIEEKRPSWFRGDVYAEPVAILRGEPPPGV